LKTVGNLQKVMLRLEANRLLAVRRVTQINQGRRTPGVDQRTYETPVERLQLAKRLMEIEINQWNPEPSRRIYIPKGKDKVRPLGIPTQIDRCLQAVVKNALEPAWEAQFEHYSFGFRPGRKTRDAITAIYFFTKDGGRPWVIDADIKGAFDHIDHTFLMEQLGHTPTRFIIEKWLKAGIMEGSELSPTLSGTPQGGIISPLLANIALHGMEAALKMERRVYPNGFVTFIFVPAVVVRYADDFVVLCQTRDDCEQAKQNLEVFLAERGLEMSPEKTSIRHIEEGFDFLGFNIRQYNRQATTKRGKKLLIRPSKESEDKVKAKIRQIFKRRLHHKPELLILELNAIIRGWSEYYRYCSHSLSVDRLDDFLWHRSWRYALRRHPKKARKWIRQKYFTQDWRLVENEREMLKFRDFRYNRELKLRYKATPDNPLEEQYWNDRRAKPTTSLKLKARLWQQQKGLCIHCQSILDTGEEIVIHHKDRDPTNNKLLNLCLVHETCHQQIHHQRTA
jgi:RNA-directed DNA polymerase